MTSTVTSGHHQGARSRSSGAWLRESRTAAGLTQEELAERSGVAVRTISDVERGVSVRPYPRSIRMLVTALNLPQALADEMIAQYRSGAMRASRLPDETGPAPDRIGDGRVSAPRRLLTVPRQLPAPPRLFIGRRSELEALASLPGETLAGSVSVISGMAGVGKTALALTWAHRAAGRFPDGQLYVDLCGFSPSASPVKPADALYGILESLGAARERIPRGLDARAGLYRSLVADRRVLVVLDNARDAEQVRPLLLSSPGCRVLITSRSRLAGLAVSGNAKLLPLDVLSEDEAHELLTAWAGARRAAAEPRAVDELVRLCAGLPLALAITAARAVAYPEVPLSGLTTELGDAASRLDALEAGDPATSVRAVLSWSYRHLEELPARMLPLLSLHPGPGITVAAAASLAGISSSQAWHALRALAGANLLTEHLPGRYALHDLLRAFAAERAEAAGEVEDHRAVICRMLDHYVHTASNADLMTSWDREPVTLAEPRLGVSPETFVASGQALSWFCAERAVLVKVTGQAAQAGFDAHACHLAWSLAGFFSLQGHWHDQIAVQRIALRAARRLGDQTAQARAHCELGFALGEGGQFRQAHPHLERALKLYQDRGDQQGQSWVHIRTGEVLSWQGRDREALASTTAALSSSPAGEAISQRQQALALGDLGWYHARLGELDQARARCTAALQLYRDAGSRFGEAITLDSLAYVDDQAGDHARAVTRARFAADQLRQIGALVVAAQVLSRLGDSCQTAGETAAARAAWQEAIQILDGVQNPNARETLAKLRQRLVAMNPW
jgi:transcriptional regulator with XRE-family HTH domain/tetratricopeptide (TPR) repeat protein